MANRYDPKRAPARKAADLSRKAARRAKSARIFLCLAFPPELASFKVAR